MVASRRITAVVEGADYLLDMETISPSKKREIAATISRAESNTGYGKRDEFYASFLDDLLEFREAKFVEEDEDDPTYLMFLDNLKEHGNAYMLDVSQEHGVSFPIKYEVEDDAPEELKRKTPKARKHTLVNEIRSLNTDGALKTGRKDSGSLKKNTRRHTFRESSSLGVDGELVSSPKSSGSGKENSRRIRILKNSSIAVAQTKNPTCKSSKDVDHSSDLNCRSSSMADTVTVDEGYGIFMSGLKVSGNSVFYEYGDGKRVYYEMSDQERSTDAKIDSKAAPRRPTTTPRQLTPSPIQSTAIPRIPPIQSIAIPRIPPIQSTATPRITTVTQRQLTLTSKQPTKDNCNMFSKSDKTLMNNQEAFRREHSWFTEKLKSIVRKPYEQKEYEDLLQKVHARTPIAVHRETRAGGYKAEGQMGNSYLDTYSDLNCEIEQVKSDPRKVLNLLRGFFLYLQKVPHGVPQPWKDKLCKRIMLGLA